jgi:hypothetical protein
MTGRWNAIADGTAKVEGTQRSCETAATMHDLTHVEVLPGTKARPNWRDRSGCSVN